MKKGIIAITLLLTGALLITPIANAISQNDGQDSTKIVKVTDTENTEVAKDNKEKTTQSKDTTTSDEDYATVVDNKSTVTEEVKTDNKKEENNKEDKSAVEEDKEEVKNSMTKSEAEAILNKYIKEVEKADFTYTYQGDENTFEAIKEKGIRGYVFLPNIETDMAYLVDKDTGSIYFFHPSGYFELLQ